MSIWKRLKDSLRTPSQQAAVPISALQEYENEGETTLLTNSPFANEGETTILTQNPVSAAPYEGETTILTQNPMPAAPVRSPAPIVQSEGETTILTQNPVPAAPVRSPAPIVQSEGETTILTQNPVPAAPVRSPASFAPSETTVLIRDDAPQKQPVKQTYACVVRAATGDVCNIQTEVFRIGNKNAPAAELRVDNPSISTNHATITILNQHYYLTDNGSTNGTYVEGTPLQPFVRSELYNGSIFTLADEIFQFFYKKG